MVDTCRTVLLIDDEPMILDLGARIIQRLGHHAIAVSTCESAYQVAAENSPAIDLVILDYGVAAPDGEKVLERLKEVNARLKILITSGFCESGPIADLLKKEGCDFIQKPFTTAELANKLNYMLS
jgi:two-component system, cell cycle sensor histidine kinase and response regulator CckA